jgi:hypothetical protein
VNAVADEHEQTIEQIDGDLRRVQASIEGARAAHRRCPSGENLAHVEKLTDLADRILDERLKRMSAEQIVSA